MTAGARARGADGRLLADDTGAVMLEFLMAFVPLFVLFLGVTQLALLAAAELVVRHAAIAGVRAAAVVLDDDPRHYDGAPRRSIDGGSSRAGLDRRFAEQLGATADSAWQAHGRGDGPRMAAIRAAVHAPLAAIAPSRALVDWLAATDLGLAIGDPASRVATGLASFIPASTAVVFASAPDSSLLHAHEVTGELIVLRVTHLVPCAVPIARTLLCRTLGWNARARRLAVAGADDATERALTELKRAPFAAGQAALALARVPMAVLTAEASLPLHAAPYAYASERTP